MIRCGCDISFPGGSDIKVDFIPRWRQTISRSKQVELATRIVRDFDIPGIRPGFPHGTNEHTSISQRCRLIPKKELTLLSILKADFRYIYSARERKQCKRMISTICRRDD